MFCQYIWCKFIFLINLYSLFSAIIILSELGIQFVINLFSFQKYFVGRGLFLIFIAILCFDKVDHLKSLVGITDLIIGIILMLYGIFLTIAGFSGDNEPLGSPVS